MSKIWHWITYQGWYTIKPNKPNQPTRIITLLIEYPYDSSEKIPSNILFLTIFSERTSPYVYKCLSFCQWIYRYIYIYIFFFFFFKKKTKDRLIHDYKFISVLYFQFLVWTKNRKEKINTGLLQITSCINFFSSCFWFTPETENTGPK